MKFISKISAGLVSLGLLVAASADDAVKFNVPGVSAGTTPAAAPATAAPAATAPAPVKVKYTEAQVFEAYGYYTGLRMGLAQLAFTKDQLDAMARGMAGAASGTQPAFDMKEIGPDVEAVLSKKNEVFMTKLRMEQLNSGAAFFSKLKENKNIVELPSGLRYEVIKAGAGAVPKVGQVVTIHYTGSLTNGQVFDSSLQPRQQGAPVEPVEMMLAPGQLIAGMVEGLQKTSVGGKIKLYIPPSLGYGDEGSQAIPPGATLIFEVELLGAKDAPPAPAAPAPAAK